VKAAGFARGAIFRPGLLNRGDMARLWEKVSKGCSGGGEGGLWEKVSQGCSGGGGEGCSRSTFRWPFSVSKCAGLSVQVAAWRWHACCWLLSMAKDQFG
jgi:hypothetical protein